jgi:GT2 family glycosyltransferase
MTHGSLPPVALALLNWNAWKTTIDCLVSLASLEYPNADFFLCDNASTDGSVDRIGAWAEERNWSTVIIDQPTAEDGTKPRNDEARLIILRSATNRGFAGGTNLAIRYALASSKPYRYVWVLNTDTTVEPHALEQLVSALEANPGAASAQSLLVSAKNHEVIDSAGMRLLRRGGATDFLRGKPRSQVRQLYGNRSVIPVFGCCGAAALYRVDSLRRGGLFDEALFAGFEDVDLACRLQQNGQSAILSVSSVVFHIGGPSRVRWKRGWIGWLSHRNKAWLVARWYPRLVGIPILTFGISRAFLAAVRFSDVSLQHWWQLVRTAWKELVGGASESIRRRIFHLGTHNIETTLRIEVPADNV